VFFAKNSTLHAGLSAFLPNSYCNALVQWLYSQPAVRAYMINHLCAKESCMCCELGFIFHQMDQQAPGLTVEPRNFLRVLRQIPETSALGLLDAGEPSPDLLLAVKIQDCQRFVLEYVNKEMHTHHKMVHEAAEVEKIVKRRENGEPVSESGGSGNTNNSNNLKKMVLSTELASRIRINVTPHPDSANEAAEKTANASSGSGGEKAEAKKETKLSPQQASRSVSAASNGSSGAPPPFTSVIEQVFGYKIGKRRMCISGGHQSEEESVRTHTTLQYPAAHEANLAFCDLLQSSLQSEMSRRVWCSTCGGYQPTKFVTRVLGLPGVLNVQCNVNTESELDLWRGDEKKKTSHDDDSSDVGMNITADVLSAALDTGGVVAADDDAAKAADKDGSDAKKKSTVGITASIEKSGGGNSLNNNFLPMFITVDVDASLSKPVVRRGIHLDPASLGRGRGGRFRKRGGDDDANGDTIAYYRLTAAVAHITDPPDSDSALNSVNGEHLVTHVIVPAAYQERKKAAAKARNAREAQERERKRGEARERMRRKAEAKAAQAAKDGDAAGELAALAAMEEASVADAEPRKATQRTLDLSSAPMPKDKAAAEAAAAAAKAKKDAVAVDGGDDDAAPTAADLFEKRIDAFSRADRNWILCNDFTISRTSPVEAANYRYPWKLPCILTYTRINVDKLVKPAAYEPFTRWVDSSPDFSLYRPTRSLSLYVHNHQPTFQCIREDEVMKAGTLVAIDCEFVCVEKETKETNSGGKEVVVRPSRLTLGRVSVVRGEGPYCRQPFVDDYISTAETVVDYLTRFSGLHPGDLDKNISPHHLTTMKAAYVRLRTLVDRGVVFVGHGLKTDFQMLNIYVPEEQIIDTFDLFYLHGQRRLGLRFLAVFVLDLDIQGKTHDSIEDARTALDLYHKYLEFKMAGTHDDKITELYNIGRKHGFKIESSTHPKAVKAQLAAEAAEARDREVDRERVAQAEREKLERVVLTDPSVRVGERGGREVRERLLLERERAMMQGQGGHNMAAAVHHQQMAHHQQHQAWQQQQQQHHHQQQQQQQYQQQQQQQQQHQQQQQQQHVQWPQQPPAWNVQQPYPH
jgi:hypothetical protein